MHRPLEKIPSTNDYGYSVIISYLRPNDTTCQTQYHYTGTRSGVQHLHHEEGCCKRCGFSVPQLKTHIKRDGIHGGYRLGSTYDLPDSRPTREGVFRSKLWSSQI